MMVLLKSESAISSFVAETFTCWSICISRSICVSRRKTFGYGFPSEMFFVPSRQSTIVLKIPFFLRFLRQPFGCQRTNQRPLPSSHSTQTEDKQCFDGSFFWSNRNKIFILWFIFNRLLELICCSFHSMIQSPAISRFDLNVAMISESLLRHFFVFFPNGLACNWRSVSVEGGEGGREAGVVKWSSFPFPISMTTRLHDVCICLRHPCMAKAHKGYRFSLHRFASFNIFLSLNVAVVVFVFL